MLQSIFPEEAALLEERGMRPLLWCSTLFQSPRKETAYGRTLTGQTEGQSCAVS